MYSCTVPAGRGGLFFAFGYGEIRMGLHLKLEPLPGGLALLTFDSPGQKVNTFSAAVLKEFSDCVAELAHGTDSARPVVHQR